MVAMDARATAVRWAALAAATALVAWLVALVGLPSSALFGALLVGVGAALIAPDRLGVPPSLFTAAQAVAGVVLGTFLDRQSLDALGGELAAAGARDRGHPRDLARRGASCSPA